VWMCPGAKDMGTSTGYTIRVLIQRSVATRPPMPNRISPTPIVTEGGTLKRMFYLDT
jgi:hypothetical protein